MPFPPPRPALLLNISPKNVIRIQECVPRSWRGRGDAPLKPPTSPPTPQSLPLLNFLISSVKSKTNLGRLSEALAAFSLLRLHRPTSSSLLLLPLSSLLSCSTSQRALPQGLQLHGLIISLGFQDHSLLVTELISFYAGCGFLLDATMVAGSSITSLSLAWNMLICAYARHGLWQDVIFTYRSMVERSVIASKYTYSSVLRACKEIGDLRLGAEIHCCISGNSVLQLDLYIWNSLLATYAKCGEINAARKLFGEMPVRDAVTWNTMISAYTSIGMWEKVSELLPLAAEASWFNTITWNCFMAGYLRQTNYLAVLRLMSELRTRNSAFDHVTLLISLKTCSMVQSLRFGKEIHGLIIHYQYDGLENIVNALIMMYCRCKRTNYAYSLFRLNSIRTMVTWNTMISGFAHAGKEKEASLIFQEMISADILPNYVTLVTMVSLCIRTKNLKHGLELHCYIIKRQLGYHHFLCNSLLDFYSKSGKMLAAEIIFDMMADHDVVSYTSLVLAYGVRGEGKMSMKLYKKMINSGIKPDSVMMVAILAACSHSRLLTEGEMLFEKMFALYGIVPQVEHFSCIVDLYCQTGFLSKAEEIISRMPLHPSPSMLSTLVIACLCHGNIEIGLRAAKQLLKIESSNIEHYLLVVDMFGFAGCWSEPAKVRTLIRNMEIVKARNFLLLALRQYISH